MQELRKRWKKCGGFPNSTVVQNPPAMQELRDTGSMHGLERSPGIGMATHFRLVAGKTQRTKELGRLQSPGLQRAGHS